MESRTSLYIVPMGANSAERYINEMLVAYVVLLTQRVAANFFVNSRPHTALIVRDY